MILQCHFPYNLSTANRQRSKFVCKGIALTLPKDSLFSQLFKDPTEKGPDLPHTETRVHKQECVPLSVYLHACITVHVCRGMWTVCMPLCVCTWVYMHVCTNVCVPIFVCVCVCVCVCVFERERDECA